MLSRKLPPQAPLKIDPGMGEFKAAPWVVFEKHLGGIMQEKVRIKEQQAGHSVNALEKKWGGCVCVQNHPGGGVYRHQRGRP